MAQLLTDPSQAFVLGTLNEVHREWRTLSAALAQPEGDPEALGQALLALAGAKKGLLALRADHHSVARKLGEKNQQLGDVLPRLAKLQARSAALGAAQTAAAQSAPESARALRRSRAVVDVQIEDLNKDGQQLQNEAQALRMRLHELDDKLRAGRSHQQAAQALVMKYQAGRPALLPKARLCALQLAMAHGNLRTAGPEPSQKALELWAQEVRQVAATWLALGADMEAGRFDEDTALAVMGGRHSLTAEVLAGLVVLGDHRAANDMFERLCADHGFLHQLFFVFRAFALGLYLRGDPGPLVEVLRLHRYAQGLRGALAECLWQLIRGDSDGFARQLPLVVAHEAQMWAASDLPGLGLVSLMSCALCRLGIERGFVLPTNLGPTVPVGPWLMAPATLLG